MKIAAIVTALLAVAGVLGSAPAALAQSAESPAPRTITSRFPAEPSPAGGPGQGHAAPPPARGRYRTISVPHATQTTPEDINNSGMIVGCYQPAAGPTRGFTDRGGRFTTITDPAASHRSQVRGCVLGTNSRGVLVGYYLSASGAERAFVDRGGHFAPVNAPGAGRRPGQGTIAVDINDSGAVAGYYTGRRGKFGFVLRHARFTDPALPARQQQHLGQRHRGQRHDRGRLHQPPRGAEWLPGLGRRVQPDRGAGRPHGPGQGHGPGVHLEAHRPGRRELLATRVVVTAGRLQRSARRLPDAQRSGRHPGDRAAVRQ
ncbi:MAG: hypothetical protein ACRDRJ_11780 [Streptosporangiaceae bacterium]